jgi:hypothetical protein
MGFLIQKTEQGAPVRICSVVGWPSTGLGLKFTGPPVLSDIKAPIGKARETDAIRLLMRSSSQTQLRWKSGN